MKLSRHEVGVGPGPISVIEEVADNIYSVKFIIQSLGFRVRSFASKDPYLCSLVQFSPCLIVVDMMIPNGGGYEVIQQIRSSSLEDVPILAITAEAMPGNEEDVYRVGGQDVLWKPYTITDLQKKLNKWLTVDNGGSSSD